MRFSKMFGNVKNFKKQSDLAIGVVTRTIDTLTKINENIEGSCQENIDEIIRIQKENEEMMNVMVENEKIIEKFSNLIS